MIWFIVLLGMWQARIASTPDVDRDTVWLKQTPDQSFPEDQRSNFRTTPGLENSIHPSPVVLKCLCVGVGGWGNDKYENYLSYRR